VPYQLQTLAQLADETELLVFTELDVLVATLVEVLLLVATLMEVLLLVAALVEVAVALDVEGAIEEEGTLEDEGILEEDGVLELLTCAPLQTLPDTEGISAVPPFLAPWKPNSIDCPGAMLPFQPRFVAV